MAYELSRKKCSYFVLPSPSPQRSEGEGGRNAIGFTGNTKNIGEATHQSQETPEQEVNAAIDIALDVYLYAIGTNIKELEMSETTRVQA